MNSFEFLEKLGFSSNEAKVYGTLIKHKVLNGYEIAKLSGVARSLVYEVINRLIAKGAVIRIDGEPNLYKLSSIKTLSAALRKKRKEYCLRRTRTSTTRNGKCRRRLRNEYSGRRKIRCQGKETYRQRASGNFAVHLAGVVRSAA